MRGPFVFEIENFPSQPKQEAHGNKNYHTDFEGGARRMDGSRRGEPAGRRTRSGAQGTHQRSPSSSPPRRRRPRQPRPVSYRPPYDVRLIQPDAANDAGAGNDAAPQRADAEYIRWAQTSLNQALGLNLPVDGVISVETRSAVRSFQKKNGLPADGKLGADTERALMDASGSEPPKDQDQQLSEYELYEQNDPEMADYEIDDEVDRTSSEYGKWVQQSLNKILSLRLTVDGIVGPQTRSAIRSFQQQRGLTADGIVGSQTEAALIAAGAGSPPQSSGTPTTAPDIVTVRGIQVARQIASQVDALLAAAEADGVRLSGGGYRSMQRQIELRKQNCGPTQYDIYQKSSSLCSPPTAIPGQSNHEKGLAIDFTYNGDGIKSHDNPGFKWLASNAARFGLRNLPSEEWHWSVDGR